MKNYDLDETLKARCEAKIQEILPLLTTDEKDLGLMTGKAGFALAYAYAYQHYQDPKLLEQLNTLVDGIMDEIGQKPLPPSLCGGLAGIGYMFYELVQMGLLDADLDELLGEINFLLHNFRHLKESNGFPNYDYLHGTVGIGFYFLTIGKHNLAFELLQDLIDSREEVTESTWRFKFYNSHENEFSYNLGLAHGLPSYIIYAAKCYKVCTDEAFKIQIEQFMVNALNYVESQKLPDREFCSIYPNGSTIGKEAESIHASRLGWCYGDLGIATAYWLAGEALQNDTFLRRATEIMLHSTKRIQYEDTMLVDYTFCHGTVGLADIYRLFYERTGRVEFQNAYLFWLAQTLNLATFDDGLAGYKKYYKKDNTEWQCDYGVITGITGIVCCFLQYLHQEQQNNEYLFIN